MPSSTSAVSMPLSQTLQVRIEMFHLQYLLLMYDNLCKVKSWWVMASATFNAVIYIVT